MNSHKMSGSILHKSKSKKIIFDDDGEGFVKDDDELSTKKKWYDNFPASLQDDVDSSSALTDQEKRNLKDEAQKLLENSTSLYESRPTKQSIDFDPHLMRNMLARGTTADKIAAYTLLIQDSPVHNITALKNLINLVKPSKKRDCITAADTLTELFLTDLLPNRKLRYFDDCPLSQLTSLSAVDRKSVLILWYFEDQLKQLYSSYIQSVQALSLDTVESNKAKAVAVLSNLLTKNPEQEGVLLTTIVNKLGDPSPKIASKAIFCLRKLLKVHLNMKEVVIHEVEKLLFRPNISPRAQYYGICFLTQIYLSNSDEEVAVNLIKLYFSFFKACIKKGEVNTRLLSAVLTGVTRAYPFASNRVDQISEHIEAVYRIAHIGSFTVSLHALTLLFKVSDRKNAVADRFYSALYKKVMDPQLGISSQQSLFLWLIYNALKKDTSIARTKAFIKRLLQASLYWPVPLVCAVLYTISQITHKRNELLALNHIKSIVDDENGSDDEHYEDIKIEDDDVKEVESIQRSVDPEEEKGKDIKPTNTHVSWFHANNAKSDVKSRITRNEFDPFYRNPLFAGGDHCVYMELVHLKEHFHPTISLYASKILQGETISYSGDPLQDYSLAKFLDRFAFKNPKKNITKDENEEVISFKKKTRVSGIRSLPVNSTNYLNQDESKIPVDELFLYRYLNKKREEDTIKLKDDDDADSVASEEFEEMLDGLMGRKNEDIDFADEVGEKLKNKQKGKGKKSQDEQENYTSEEEEGEEEEENDQVGSDDGDFEKADFDEDAEFDDDDDDDNVVDDFEGEEALDFEDDDDDADIAEWKRAIEEKLGHKSENKKNLKNTLKKKNKGFNSVFASADEFAEMLQETGASDIRFDTLDSVSASDGTNPKQLKWEMARNDWTNNGSKNQQWNNKRKHPGKKFINKKNNKRIKKR